MNLSAYEHCIFWIVRNHYFKKDDQIFTSVFGEYFEEYYRELLSTYLVPNVEYVRIPETDTKRADWKLEIDGYKFLVEQKATLLTLQGKQQVSDIEASKRFAKQAIIKAIKQLHNTEQEFADGKYIKIILMYEDYLKTEILDNVFAMEECKIENDHYYWLVTVNEMERLLSLCASDRDAFDRIIAEKVRREVTESHDGRGLLQLLIGEGYKDNPYLRKEKFLYYRNLAINHTREQIRE